LHPRFEPNQCKDLTEFVDVFVKKIEEHSALERLKYPETYAAPKPDDLIIDRDDVVIEIAKRVNRLSILERTLDPTGEHNPAVMLASPGGICQHLEDVECLCDIPFKERKQPAFLRPYIPNHCYQFIETNGDAFYNLEIVKCLLQLGEMEPLLRVCAHPDVDLDSWWQVQECMCMVSFFRLLPVELPLSLLWSY
jgi:hypothetical protein